MGNCGFDFFLAPFRALLQTGSTLRYTSHEVFIAETPCGTVKKIIDHLARQNVQALHTSCDEEGPRENPFSVTLHTTSKLYVSTPPHHHHPCLLPQHGTSLRGRRLMDGGRYHSNNIPHERGGKTKKKRPTDSGCSSAVGSHCPETCVFKNTSTKTTPKKIHKNRKKRKRKERRPCDVYLHTRFPCPGPH